MTEGMSHRARSSVLAEAAARDLLHNRWSQAKAPKGEEWGAILVGPPAESARFGHSAEPRGKGADQDLFAMLQGTFQLPLRQGRMEMLRAGAAGVGLALQRASEWLTTRAVAKVLILAADSLLDPMSLDWLAADRRLKTDEDPAGMAPGEAGVALLLGPGIGTRRHQATILTHVVEGAELAWSSPDRLAGRQLASALRKSATANGAPLGPDLYCNLNGESWRAHEFGTALATAMPSVGTHRLQVPATSVGDTGAASGCLAVVAATHDLARSRARSQRSWVVATSDHGPCCILGLEATSDER